MKSFIIGIIIGIVISSVGVSGIANILDKGIATVKTQSQRLSDVVE